MAIVPNLNGAPISPGTPLVDPHSESSLERSFHNDLVTTDVSIANLAAGEQVILAANALRRAIRVTNPGASTIAIGLQPLATVNAKGAVPIASGATVTWQGPVCAQAIHCFGVAAQNLTIWVG